MASWQFMRRRSGGRGGNPNPADEKVVVLDGTEIRDLVEDKEAFRSFAEHKFQELDVDGDGKLSVSELEPAVADIGAALGLPAQGSSSDSDHIYSEVLSEFTHGKQDQVSKSDFKEVLSDILLGMAAGLKRDPIVILRMDGQDLKEFVESSSFQTEAVAIFSKLQTADVSLRDSLMIGIGQLTVEQGMPPSSDAWVISSIVEPSFQTLTCDLLCQSLSEDLFLEEFKKLLLSISQNLGERPAIIAHSQNRFDGSGIKRLLSNKFELDKLLELTWRDLPKDQHHKISKNYLRVALDGMASSANLPPIGAIAEFDAVVNEVLKMVEGDDGNTVKEKDFKKAMAEILGGIMLQLEGNPIAVSSNAAVHEPMVYYSALFPEPERMSFEDD